MPIKIPDCFYEVEQAGCKIHMEIRAVRKGKHFQYMSLRQLDIHTGKKLTSVYFKSTSSQTQGKEDI